MVKDYLVNWFLTELKVQLKEEDCTVNFLESGWVDSFGFIQLITEVEEKFQVSLLEDDLTEDTLFTILGMSQMIERKMNHDT